MSPALDVRRLFAESVPIAVVLLFWSALSVLAAWLDFGAVAGRLRLAGVVMATLYAVVGGARLARTAPATPAPDDVGEVVRENAGVALAAAGWFLAAALVYVVEVVWRALDVPGAFTSPADALASALAGAGVGTVLLYAVTVGLQRVRTPVADPTPSDD